MELAKWRKQIDKLDEKIVKALGQRKKVIEKVAKYKKKYKLEIFDKKRENQIAKNLAKLAHRHGLGKSYLYELWDKIIHEAKEVQKKIVKK